MKNLKKILVLFLIVTLALSMTACTKIRINDLFSISTIDCEIENYNDRVSDIGYANDYMPNLSELNGYTGISYSHKYTLAGLTFLLPMFATDGITLFVEYPEDVYEQKKEEVLANYDFITKEIYDRDGYLISPLAKFEYKGYNFQADVNENYSFCPIKSFILIGYNDETRKISYCYFYDPDIDYIATDEEDPLNEMHKFMSEKFSWND